MLDAPKYFKIVSEEALTARETKRNEPTSESSSMLLHQRDDLRRADIKTQVKFPKHTEGFASRISNTSEVVEIKQRLQTPRREREMVAPGAIEDTDEESADNRFDCYKSLDTRRMESIFARQNFLTERAKALTTSSRQC